MSVWDNYRQRVSALGTTRRDIALRREARYIDRKLPNNLSYQTVTIDGEEQNVAILRSDNLNEKYIYSMTGGDLTHGGLVYWEENYWLITEKDAANELYTRGIMIQCNYLLKWVSPDGRICEQWCIVEDGTKYLTGEFEDRNFIVTRGDTRMYLTITRTPDTAKFTREQRFLIDDPESPHITAYQLTKPLKVGIVYNGVGVFKFVLQEVATTDNDNTELMIPDYYKYFPRQSMGQTPPDNDDGRRNWL